MGLSPVGTTTKFYDGNILMGGDGNDTLIGKGGFDILDGDAWLNVRIKIVIANGPNAGTYSAESLNSDTTVAGPHAGKVYNINPDGSPNFADVAFGGRSLTSLMVDRTINPGEMSIVREIQYDNTNLTGFGWNIDTAVFRGTMAEYDVEGSVDLNGDGDSNDADEFAAIDVNLDGFISVRDRDNGSVGAIVNGVQLPSRRLLDANGLPIAGGLFTDDLDLLKNIEQLRFSDQTVQIVDLPTLVNWNGVRSASENALPDNGEVIATLSMASGAVVNPIWSVTSGTAPVTVTGGVVTTTAALAANSVYTLTVRATETGNTSVFVEEFITIRTGTAGADSLNGDVFTDVIYALAGDDLVNGLGGNDTLFGQAGNDTLNGGSGSDNLTGGIDNDIVNGGTGNDTINYVIGDGVDTVDGGSGSDRLVLTSNVGNQTLAVTLNAAGVMTNFQGGSVTGVESVTADLGGGTDTLIYTAPGGVTVNLVNGTATGFTSIAGIENVNTNGGSDTVTGDGNNNVLNAGGAADIVNGGDGNDSINGGAGDDTINGDAGDDIITYAMGGGADTVDGGADFDELRVITNAAANDTLDVIVNGAGVVTSIEGGSVTNVERITVNLGTGFDRISYAGSAIGVTVNLAVPSATGLFSIANTEDVTGTAQADILTGNNLANILDGGAGNDIMNGGLGNDDLNGDAGLDTFTYVMGGGADNVDGGSQSDTLNIITAGNANDQLDVIVNGAGVVTSIEGGSITSVETINVNLGGGNNTITYAGSASGVTVNLGGLGAPVAATGLASVINTQNVTGTAQADTLTGSNAVNILNGGAGADTINGAGGNDTINGGTGGDTLIGGIGSDTINTGAANDDVVDLIQFTAAGTAEFGDTINNFDANGIVDRVEFGGSLNTLFDNGTNDDNIQFVSGDGANGGNTAVNLGVTEALFLNGANGEGVTNGSLDNAGAVATEFNAEFALTALNNQATLLVINDTNGTSAAVWRWVQNTAPGGNTAEIDANELVLIGVVNANATVTTASFDFF